MTNTQPEAEEMPGYDGPTLDAADRLHMWMDKSVPVADRDRLIAEHRDQVLTEAADELARIADETEAKVAAYYGPASGIGPGSAEMVREAARTVRGLAARTTTAQEG